jgi:hypothetical protein
MSSVSVSPDGTLVAKAGSSDVVRLSEAGTGADAGSLVAGPTTAVVFDGDTQRLITAGTPGVLLWDVSDTTLRSRLCSVAGGTLSNLDWLTWIGDWQNYLDPGSWQNVVGPLLQQYRPPVRVEEEECSPNQGGIH